MHPARGILGVVLVVSCFAVACGGDVSAPVDDGFGGARGGNATPGAPSAAEQSLRDLILGIAPPDNESASPLTATDEGNGTENRSGQLMDCVYKRYQGKELYDTLVSFDPNGDSLWPGSVVQTRNLSNGLLEPVALARRPGTITFTSALGDASASLSRELPQPSLASTQDAISQVLAGGSLRFPTKVNYRAEEAHSLVEAASKVGVAVEWMSGSVKSSFDGAWADEKTTYMVSFTQSYYTVNFSPPATPEAVFDPSTRIEDARLYMGPGNLPAYVAGVTYGRMLLVKIESSASSQDLKAALDVAFSAGSVSGEVNATFDYKKVLRDANVNVFALGGDAGIATEIMTNADARADKIAEFLHAGATFSPQNPGVPISYTVRLLANNQLVKVASTLDYRVPVCSNQMSRFRLVLDSFDVPSNGDSVGKGEMDMKIYARSELMTGGGAQAPAGDCTTAQPDNCGKKLFEQSFHKVSDGAHLTITQSQEHRLEAEARDGEVVELILWAKDNGAGTTESFVARDPHVFSIVPSAPGAASGLWSGTGSRTFAGSDRGLEIRLNYHLELLP